MKTSIFVKMSRAVIASLLTLTLLAACGGDKAVTYDETDYSEDTDLFSQPVNSPGQPNSAQQQLAVVNGATITVAQAEAEIQAMLAAQRRQISPEMLQQQRPQLMQMAVNSLIQRELLMQYSRNNDITVEAEEVEEALETIRAQMPEGQSLEMMLNARNMTMEAFRSNFEEQILLRKTIESITADLDEPTDEEVRQFYEEQKDQFKQQETVTASHILVAFEEGDDEAAKAEKMERAESIRQKLLDGADFAETAKTDSDGPSATRGGSLGAFPRGRMVPAFEEAAFTQEVGEVGDIVETRFGYHIILTQDRQDARSLSFEEVKDDIATMLQRRQQQQAIQNKIEELRQQADIEMAQGA